LVLEWIAGFAVYVSLAAAQDAETDLRRAMEAAADGRHAEAAGILRDLLGREPDRVDAWYFLGVCWNRLGVWAAAEEALEKAFSLGADSGALWRERGIAAFGQGDAPGALEFLEKAPADDAEVHFVRGETLLSERRYAEAIEALDRALSLNPRYETKIRLLRARALNGLGRAQEARAEVGKGWQKAQGTDLQAPYERQRAWLVREGRSRGLLSGSVTLGFRYDDNALLIPDDESNVAEDLTDEEDAQGTARLRVDSHFYRRDDTTLGATGIVHASSYADLDDYDLIEGVLLAWGSRAVGPLAVSLFAGGEYATLDSDSYRSAWIGSILARVRWEDDLGVWASYSRHEREYLGQTGLNQEDRDGPFHAVEFGSSFRPGEEPVRMELSILYDRANAQGDSVRYEAKGIQAGLRWGFSGRWEAWGGGRWKRFDYDEANVRNGFTEEREDRQAEGFAGLSWEYSDSMVVEADLAYTNHRSNLEEVFQYDRFTVGVSVSYLF